jgi:hypothetical protein
MNPQSKKPKSQPSTHRERERKKTTATNLLAP